MTVAKNTSLHRPVLFTAMHHRYTTDMWLPFLFGDTPILRSENSHETDNNDGVSFLKIFSFKMKANLLSILLTSRVCLFRRNVFYYAARSLCINASETYVHRDMTVTIQVMTHNIHPITFSVFLGLTDDLELRHVKFVKNHLKL